MDFHGIALSTLRKYKKAHQVRLRSGQHKEDLAEAITHHFANIPPPSDEANVIEAFSQAIRNHGMCMDICWLLIFRSHQEASPSRLCSKVNCLICDYSFWFVHCLCCMFWSVYIQPYMSGFGSRMWCPTLKVLQTNQTLQSIRLQDNSWNQHMMQICIFHWQFIKRLCRYV